MKASKDSVSVRQLFFVFTVIVSSPATRYLPRHSAFVAAQAGWLSPLVCAVPLIMLILIVDSLLKKYEGKSMADIITALFGKYLGNGLNIIYLLWVLWLLALYTRYYVERLTSSVYPNIGNNVLMILTLIPIAYILRSGFTVIARMSEVLLPFIGAMLILLSIFLFPRIRSDNILPVSYNDIIPIIKASLSSITVLSYLFPLFFLSDKLVNIKSLKRFGYIAAYINISSLVLLIFITIGVLSSTVAARTPLPVLSAVKQVTILDTIENIEAIIVAIWIFADFTLISTLLVVEFKLFKSIFKLSDTRPLINIMVVLVYFLAMGICSDKFELEAFSDKLIVPINITFGFIFPVVLFVLSKLKKGEKGEKAAKKKANPS